MAEKTSFKTISENRQVRHEYFVEETYEAGIRAVWYRGEEPAGRNCQYEGQLVQH